MCEREVFIDLDMESHVINAQRGLQPGNDWPMQQADKTEVDVIGKRAPFYTLNDVRCDIGLVLCTRPFESLHLCPQTSCRTNGVSSVTVVRVTSC